MQMMQTNEEEENRMEARYIPPQFRLNGKPTPKMLQVQDILSTMQKRELYCFFQWYSPLPNYGSEGLPSFLWNFGPEADAYCDVPELAREA